jgi:CheY-like chemotaxis protein
MCVDMTPQKPLSLLDSQPEAVSVTVEDRFPSDALQYGKRRRRSPLDTAQLALAFVMLAVLAGLIYVSELDSVYWTNMRITAFVQRALGIRWPVDDGSAARARRVIVITESDDGQRLIAKTTLERYGYTVALADNGTQAEALLRKAGPRVALVILDREALRNAASDTIRQLKSIQPDVRILMSQAAGEDPPKISGAAGSIERPFSSVPLAEAVQRALGPK